jgi:hypothetical protein
MTDSFDRRWFMVQYTGNDNSSLGYLMVEGINEEDAFKAASTKTTFPGGHVLIATVDDPSFIGESYRDRLLSEKELKSAIWEKAAPKLGIGNGGKRMV